MVLVTHRFEMAQFSVVGSQATVNVHTPNCDRGVKRQVLVTPLTAAAPTIQRRAMESSHTAQSTGMISKLLIKVFSRSNKKESKMFALRNISTQTVVSREQLKSEIAKQLKDDVSGQFDVGFIQGASLVSIRTSRDLSEVWGEVLKGSNVTLWCDGLKRTTVKTSTSRKRAHGTIDSENESSGDEQSNRNKRRKKLNQEDRQIKINEITKDLSEKHGQIYTQMQYRIWAEMMFSELHSSSDEPPNTSMFVRAGGSAPRKKSNNISDALTHVADRIAAVLSPSSSPKATVGRSPAKLIENCSKCYKQLSELNNLRTAGVLSDSEYQLEKDSVMETLKGLQN